MPGSSKTETITNSPIYSISPVTLLILVSLSPILSLFSSVVCYQTDIVDIFYDPDVERLNHLVVDRNTGQVFVGGVNELYQLSPNLDLVVKETTGPKYDSTECSALNECPLGTFKKLTDNVNKALVIDYSTTRIISCGSLFEGRCTVRNLHNISDVAEEVYLPVVANDATASTVAFIAPGPPNPPVSQVMYVGITYTGSRFYDNEPVVSSRSLDKESMFRIASWGYSPISKDLKYNANVPVVDPRSLNKHIPFLLPYDPTLRNGGTHVALNHLAKERFPINYVYGFSSEGFSYFLTTQPKYTATGSDFISKLVRVCHNDPTYFSYTEMPIDCTNGVRNYNLVQAAYAGKAGSDLAGHLGITAQEDVLFAVFSESKSTTNTPSSKSALCFYSLKAIRSKFITNLQNCSFDDLRHLRRFEPISLHGHHQCEWTQEDGWTAEDLCGADFIRYLGRKYPVATSPVLSFDEHLTAVAATATGDDTVVFVGTKDGHLRKVLVETATSALKYGDLEIDRTSPVHSDMHFDPQLMHLYVMTKQKISKIKVQSACSAYETWRDCLVVKDPYCGWCMSKNRCTIKSDCPDLTTDQFYWMSYKLQYVKILNVTPNELQRTTTKTLHLVIENLPSSLRKLICAFSALDKTLITNATRKSYGLNCSTPTSDHLPSIQQTQHYLTAKLSVRTTNGFELDFTNFTFFDCNTYASCTECISSSFPCYWCVDGHRCTHDTFQNCRNNISVTGVNRRTGPNDSVGARFCPRMNAMGNQEILIPFGTKRPIRVKVDIPWLLIAESRFVCQFNIEGNDISMDARLSADTIYCDSTEFSYTSMTSNITVPFAVLWGDSKRLDNIDNIHVVIYRCRYMADNCGNCLTLPEKYGCGWCQSSNKCEVKDQCDRSKGFWLHKNQRCPNPEVNSFKSQIGPWKLQE